MPRGETPHGLFIQSFFSRFGPLTTRLVDTFFGSGNSLIDRERCGFEPAPFDVAADLTGGEDDLFFSRLKARGARFVWAANALVVEHVARDRATMPYVLVRAFRQGQGVPALYAARGGLDMLIALAWMGVGGLQTLGYGLAFLIAKATGRESRCRFAVRAAQGLGKIFWMEPLRPKLYGAPARKRSRISDPIVNTSPAVSP